MRGYMFLIMSLLISPAISKKQSGPKIVAIGEDHDIPEINNGHHGDDILLPLKKQRSSIIDRSILWTSPVSYVLDKGLEMNAKGVTLRAFDQFRLKSCIDFKPRDSEDYYISVQKLDGKPTSKIYTQESILLTSFGPMDIRTISSAVGSSHQLEPAAKDVYQH